MHYDVYILKAILCGYNPYAVSDYIINKGEPGWKYSGLFRMINVYSYDCMVRSDRGLKFLEGSMGINIKETSVPFDINRKLTKDEINETVYYCTHDVESTILVFLNRKDTFQAKLQLLILGGFGLSYLSKSNTQLTADILQAQKILRNDEFDLDFPPTLLIEKYAHIKQFYLNNKSYTDENGKKIQLTENIGGLKHTFGYGGLHAGKTHYHGRGYFVNMDVASLYPSLMIEYDLLSRNVAESEKYKEIYNRRIELKKQGNSFNKALKLVLNSTYGAMKDFNNKLYDPRQANRVCIYGQMLMLDLLEKIEPISEIIQTNTDGILVRKPDYMSIQSFEKKIKDVTDEWQKRTKLNLEFDYYEEIWQKDVNNYIAIGKTKVKRIGAYVKKLNNLDYGDYPIVNEALVEYMIHGTDIEYTIRKCRSIKKFQCVSKISQKFQYIVINTQKINEKCVRIFASRNAADSGLTKIHRDTGKPFKVANSPDHCLIRNEDINNELAVGIDKQFYIDLAKKRLEGFK